MSETATEHPTRNHHVVDLLGPLGLPEGVDPDSVLSVSTGPDTVRLVSVSTLPPRYEGHRTIALYGMNYETARSLVGRDEEIVTTMMGGVYAHATRRTVRTTWAHDGSGWRKVDVDDPAMAPSCP